MIEQYKVDPELEERVRETLRCSYDLIAQSRQLMQRSKTLVRGCSLSKRGAIVKKDSRPTQAQ
jgi:hypothetical protein